MLHRVSSEVKQRFDSSRADDSELVPLTLADDDGSPLAGSSSGSSPGFTPSRFSTPGNSGGAAATGLQGKKLAYAGSVSDLNFGSERERQDAKYAGRGPSPTDGAAPLLDRIKRAASDGVSQVSAISGRTLAAARSSLHERQARLEIRSRTASDVRFDALERLVAGEPAGAELEALWAFSSTSGPASLPQLCAHLITHASATMRWPEEEEGGLGDAMEGVGNRGPEPGDDDENGGLLPNLSPSKRQAEAASLASRLAEPEPEPELRSNAPGEGSGAPLGLPEGWTEHWEEEHSCFFYYNEETEQSSWERPQLVEALPLPTDVSKNDEFCIEN